MKYEYLGSGWSKDEVRFFNEVLEIWRERMRDEGFWELMEVAWEVYEQENEIGNKWRKTMKPKVIKTRRKLRSLKV